MFIPDIYESEKQEDIHAFLYANSFGLLINQMEGKLTATHIPLELNTNNEGTHILKGPLSRENPQWKDFSENDQILAVFFGPHSYISSSWCDHENVPTCNYIKLTCIDKLKLSKGT